MINDLHVKFNDGSAVLRSKMTLIWWTLLT